MRKIRVGIAGTILTLLMSFSSFAGQWNKNENGWWYDNGNGTYYASCWQWIDGNRDGIAECYYFDQQGYCLMNAVTPDGYTVDNSGAWIVNGVVQTQNFDNVIVSQDYESKGEKTYLLDSIEPYIKGTWYNDTDLIKMGGETYNKGFTCAGCDSKTYFNLGGKYSELTFTAGIVRETWSDASATYKIYADDEEIYSFDMKMGDLPTTHTIDITDCRKLVFEVKDNYNLFGTGVYGYADIIVE